MKIALIRMGILLSICIVATLTMVLIMGVVQRITSYF